jgi:histidine phosphotransferase ChpT
MPYGGRILIEHDDTNWTMSGVSEKMKIEPEIWGVLSDPNSDANITAAQVHFALVPDALRTAGRKLSAELRENEITITF